ncbi:MAG: hypothetical protein SFW65_02450 [Alphaproteobacteria bacterium]|nr:hypothetical protein [Alphaproteobacteria bacterium]
MNEVAELSPMKDPVILFGIAGISLTILFYLSALAKEWLNKNASTVTTGTINSAGAISNPVVGIYDLCGDPNISADEKVLGTIFSKVLKSTVYPPRCNVLFLYCKIGADGKIENTSASLGEIIDASAASIAIVATENIGNHYIQTGKRGPHSRTNLVMTTNRNGPVFMRFFEKLFNAMNAGEPMTAAWSRLAPQIAGMEHKDCPGTIFSAELGDITFRN